MISYSESFKIKWNYETGRGKNEKGKDVRYLALRQNYNINRKNSKWRSVSTIVKIKTIPGGHLVIIIRQCIGPVASWFPVTKVQSKDTRESTLKKRAEQLLSQLHQFKLLRSTRNF